MTVRQIICSECNNLMGNGPDKDLAESTAFLRNICGLNAGDGDEAPEIRGMETGGKRYDLKPKMQPHIRPRNPLEVEITDHEIRVNIEAYSDEEAERLAQGAAAKIAKHMGRSEREAIEAIKNNILKIRASGFRPAPEIHERLQFGSGRSLNSMAKACLVLWATKVTNSEVNDVRYDKFRKFIKISPNKDELPEILQIDTRPLPPTVDEFGENPNIILATSDKSGMVHGYFRLYGAIGWRFKLCDKGAPPSQTICLISNPFDNKQWKLFTEDNAPIAENWVCAEWNELPPNFEVVQERISLMAAYATDLSRQTWLTKLVQDGLAKSGCREGDVITREHAETFSRYVSRALVAQILKIDVPEE